MYKDRYWCEKCQITKFVNSNENFDCICKVCRKKMKLIQKNIFYSDNPDPSKVKNVKDKEDSICKANLFQSEKQCIPKCPTCGSTNIKSISGTKRWVTIGLFGLASSNVGKSMECKNCGYKW